MSLTLKDFYPWNRWEKKTINTWYYSMYGEYEDATIDIDQTTQRQYLYQDRNVIRTKCGLLLLWTPLAHVLKTLQRLGNILSFYSFSYQEEGHETRSLSLKERVSEVGKDTLKIITTPALVALLEIAALYGIVNPKDGRKLYASIERASYKNFGMIGIDLFGRTPSYCAPCFQPDPTHHALGGDIRDGNAW